MKTFNNQSYNHLHYIWF